MLIIKRQALSLIIALLLLLSAGFAPKGRVMQATNSPAGTRQNSSPAAPPSTDFSKYEKKTPWKIARELVECGREQGLNYDESKVRAYTLPDLFTLANGAKVTTPAVWEQKRRGELLKLFREVLYGYAPPKPDKLAFHIVENNPRAMDGKATLKRVAIRFQLRDEPFTFHLTLFVPNHRTGKAPVFLMLNHREADAADPTREKPSEFWPAEYLVQRGYAAAVVNVSAEVEPDEPNATTGIRLYYRQHYARPDALTWGAIGAWSWAGSRAADYLETDPDIDRQRMAVIGHSRGGKTALWTGAQDTRFALTCNNEGGRSGPGIIRRNFGRELAASASKFPHWFSPNYKTYGDRVDALPVDGHALAALVAPRGFHEGEAANDLIADPRGSWLATVEASKIWAFHGKAAALKDEMPLVNDLLINGPIAYHMREGGHDLILFDWKLYLDHADSLFRVKSK